MRRNDLIVLGLAGAGVHSQGPDGLYGALRPVVVDAARSHADLAVADLTGDGRADLAVADTKSRQVFLYAGTAEFEFAPPTVLTVAGIPVSLRAVDLTGDGRTDLSVLDSSKLLVSVFPSLEGGSFSPRIDFRCGPGVSGHEIADFDRDGAPDAATFGASSATILFGRRSAPLDETSLRGDADLSGAVEINDPILVLGRLFLAGAELPCDDASDANDDGEINVSDPIAILGRLFLGAAPFNPTGALRRSRA